MSELTAVIIGSSGLIGTHVTEQILLDNTFSKVRILVRRTTPFNHPKLQQIVVDFNNIDDYASKFGEGDIIFCCIGTTNKKVKGDNAAYKKIDFEIPVNAAKIGVSKNCKKFLIVSSVGANVNSNNFYLKLKGTVEKSLKEFPFESIHIFRPGQLLGKRNEYRKGEKIFQGISKLISWILFGSLKKFHSIEASDVAKAMIVESKKNLPGIHILEYKEMMNLIK